MRRATLVVLLICLTSPAAADDTHYQDYPVGGRAVGLGGAFAALGSDSSGIFYNPAGLVDASRTSLQVSTNLYGIELFGAGIFDEFADTLFDLQTVFSELNIVPTTAAAVDAFGSRMPDGRTRHAYGIGLFIPSYRSFFVQTLGPAPTEPNAVAYQRTQLDRMINAGASYAYRVDDVWSFGVSGFLNFRSLRDSEQSSLFTVAEQGRSFTTAQTDIDAWVASMSFLIGLKAQLDDRWMLGITVGTPSIGLFSGGTARVILSGGDPSTGQSSYQIESLDDLEADTQVSTYIRAGAAYVVPEEFTLTFDLSFHAPVSYELLTIPADSRLKNSLTLVTDIQRSAVVNANVGFEYFWEDWFSTSVGAFTNFSSAPSIPGEVGDRFDEAALADVNGGGLSLVLGFFAEHVLTRAGITTSYGRGASVIAQQQELQPIGDGGDFKKVDVEQLFLFFFLSSTFQY